MSSVFRAPSQLRPNAFYRVRANGTQLYTAAGANSFTVNTNVILADMGKTIYMGNDILRKVKVMGLADDTTGNVTAYIYLIKAGGVTADIAAL
jgi:hypothetical protein